MYTCSCLIMLVSAQQSPPGKNLLTSWIALWYVPDPITFVYWHFTDTYAGILFLLVHLCGFRVHECEPICGTGHWSYCRCCSMNEPYHSRLSTGMSPPGPACPEASAQHFPPWSREPAMSQSTGTAHGPPSLRGPVQNKLTLYELSVGMNRGLICQLDILSYIFRRQQWVSITFIQGHYSQAHQRETTLLEFAEYRSQSMIPDARFEEEHSEQHLWIWTES